MDTRSITVILLKITGLVLIVIAISGVPSYFPLTGGDYNFSVREVLATAAAALGPLAVFGLILWFFPGTVANKIVSGAPLDASAADARPLELVALTILGVYLVTHAIFGVVRDGTFLIIVSRDNGNLSAVPPWVSAHIVATIVELLIGAGLCIGARGVARLIERLRG
ncbi:MAG: hypothetical protein WA190_01825 [Usitatibacter sp.]